MTADGQPVGINTAIIVAVDGREISGSADLRNRIGLSPAGSRVEITYLRDGARLTVTMTVNGETGRSRTSTNAMPDRLAGANFQDASGNVLVANVAAGSGSGRCDFDLPAGIAAVQRRRAVSHDCAEPTPKMNSEGRWKMK